MREVDKILDQNEQVFWEGKPKFWPYFLYGSVSTFLFGLIWMGFLTPFIAVNFIPMADAPDAVGTAKYFLIGWNVFLIPFLLVGLWMLVGGHIYKMLLYKHLHYYITSKRVIFQKGLIGRDFEFVDFDQITNAEVNVGFWDKILKQNSGSILVFTASSVMYSRNGDPVPKPYVIYNAENPYEVFKFFKKVSHDVKTDIQYPNQYRPMENPGYQSTYDPNKK